ncbi:MAG: hypothetical protein IPK82_30000 [Polyangiaceae bacterium]|nr:hypothetical protein [Polyangiaceae bacterium]
MFGRKTGLALFHENYDADRLPPLTEAERKRLDAFSKCVACGLCDVGEGERIAQSKGAYPGIMRIVLASSRSMPDYDAAVLALDHVPEEALREKERVCPASIPFVDLARFVRKKAAAGASAQAMMEARNEPPAALPAASKAKA